MQKLNLKIYTQWLRFFFLVCVCGGGGGLLHLSSFRIGVEMRLYDKFISLQFIIEYSNL
jgi:hypothetical protein